VQNIANFPAWAGRRADCLGDFVHKNEGAITAISTFIIAVFTWTLWWANRIQTKHTREVERAYIWGGGPLSQKSPKALILTVNNYGKTPGLLIEYAVGFCSQTDIPRTPEYSVRQKFHDWIPPISEMIRPIHNIELPPIRDPLIYGRFWFRDIWGGHHSIGFILVTIIDNDGREGTSAIIPREVSDRISSAYTDWS